MKNHANCLQAHPFYTRPPTSSVLVQRPLANPRLVPLASPTPASALDTAARQHRPPLAEHAYAAAALQSSLPACSRRRRHRPLASTSGVGIRLDFD